MTRNFDEVQTVDKQAHMANHSYADKHSGTANTHGHLRLKIGEYEEELARFNLKYGEGEETGVANQDMQQMTIKLMLPDGMRAGFSGDMPEDPGKLKERIGDYIGDCRAAAAMERSSKSTKEPPNHMKDAWNGDWEETSAKDMCALKGEGNNGWQSKGKG